MMIRDYVDLIGSSQKTTEYHEKIWNSMLAGRRTAEIDSAK